MISLLVKGPECEEIYGSLRLAEATLWAMLLQSIEMLALGIFGIFDRNGVWSSLGFSGILYFYSAMSYSAGHNDNFRQVFIVAKMLQEMVEVFRGESWLAPFVHLMGGVNGFIYARFIMNKIKLPAALLCTWEDRLEDCIEHLLSFVGKEDSGWLEVVLTHDDDEDCDYADMEDANGQFDESDMYDDGSDADTECETGVD